jgi:hypothetical protein
VALTNIVTMHNHTIFPCRLIIMALFVVISDIALPFSKSQCSDASLKKGRCKTRVKSSRSYTLMYFIGKSSSGSIRTL